MDAHIHICVVHTHRGLLLQLLQSRPLRLRHARGLQQRLPHCGFIHRYTYMLSIRTQPHTLSFLLNQSTHAHAPSLAAASAPLARATVTSAARASLAAARSPSTLAAASCYPS